MTHVGAGRRALYCFLGGERMRRIWVFPILCLISGFLNLAQAKEGDPGMTRLCGYGALSKTFSLPDEDYNQGLDSLGKEICSRPAASFVDLLKALDGKCSSWCKGKDPFKEVHCQLNCVRTNIAIFMWIRGFDEGAASAATSLDHEDC